MDRLTLSVEHLNPDCCFQQRALKAQNGSGRNEQEKLVPVKDQPAPAMAALQCPDVIRTKLPARKGKSFVLLPP
jgi:hypothetical protein